MIWTRQILPGLPLPPEEGDFSTKVSPAPQSGGNATGKTEKARFAERKKAACFLRRPHHGYEIICFRKSKGFGVKTN
jgi:hypothetical protein